MLFSLHATSVCNFKTFSVYNLKSAVPLRIRSRFAYKSNLHIRTNRLRRLAVTKFIAMTVMNLVTPKVAAKRELLLQQAWLTEPTQAASMLNRQEGATTLSIPSLCTQGRYAECSIFYCYAECSIFYCYAECRYDECHYAECRGNKGPLNSKCPKPVR